MYKLVSFISRICDQRNGSFQLDGCSQLNKPQELSGRPRGGGGLAPQGGGGAAGLSLPPQASRREKTPHDLCALECQQSPAHSATNGAPVC